MCKKEHSNSEVLEELWTIKARMARETRAESAGSDSDALPDLNMLLQRPRSLKDKENLQLKRSPQKMTAALEVETSDVRRVLSHSSKQLQHSQHGDAPREQKLPTKIDSRHNRANTGSQAKDCSFKTLKQENPSRQQQRPQKSLKLANVNMLRAPPGSSSAVTDIKPERKQERSDVFDNLPDLARPFGKKPESVRRNSPSRKAKQQPQYTYRGYVSNSDEEEELTDLSGFIVDDDAELSHHEWNSSSDSEYASGEEIIEKPKPRRRLVRRRDMKKYEKPQEEEGDGIGDLVGAIETIDLTSSPQKGLASPKTTTTSGDSDDVSSPTLKDPTMSENEKSQKRKALFENGSSAVLKFSPPRSRSPFKVPSKPQTQPGESIFSAPSGTGFETPPSSPSKPKLSSPAKARARQIPQSPHRQSVDAFWSSEVINEWNDNYSPQKPPMTSPRKRALAKFLIHSNDDSNTEGSASSNISTPTASPNRKQQWSTSISTAEEPQTSPSKLKKALLAEKKAAKEAKATFESTKQDLATTFLKALDQRITKGQLATLSSSTGGIKIVWSNTLRSTAGRANWKRTVQKPSSNSSTSISTTTISNDQPKIHHHATIELSTKVLTTRSRLLNTLAHEFCHLANFMISNIRDQPHGTSFKSWAQKVTSEFAHDVQYGLDKIEVTTKHDYAIEWKYLWVCGGELARREIVRQSEVEVEAGAGAGAKNQNKSSSSTTTITTTKPGAGGGGGEKKEKEEGENDNKFLTQLLQKLSEGTGGGDNGCGTEYGRHSKSIDTRKHRCGKCKGGLVQVRPKPRSRPRSRPTKSESREGGGGGGDGGSGKKGGGGRFVKKEKEDAAGIEMLVKGVEVVELSD